MSRAAAVLEALRGLPGGAELLELACTRDDGCALVGGATRDLLLERRPRELDVVVAGDAAAFAVELAGLLGGSATVVAHGRFGTAALRWREGAIDVAERRAETYARPGALPDVRAGSAEEDLLRRDFTVNAIAAPLAGDGEAVLASAPLALEDLAARRLRVTHERSFRDDPTRVLRLARYSARLGFEAEPQTAALAAEALADGALSTVSRARIGAELRLALNETDAVAAIEALDEIGALAAIEPRLCLDVAPARRALELLPDDGRPDLLLLAMLLLELASRDDGAAAMFELLEPMEFAAPDRELAMRSALLAPGLLARLDRVDRPSRARALLAHTPTEAVALAAGLAPREPDRDTGAALALAERWLSHWRHVRLQITGEDLLAAGLSSGPEIGARLALALDRLLDGHIEQGREAELRAALDDAVSGAAASPDDAP